MDKPELLAGKLLSERRLTVSCAESCTGGLLTSRLTDVAGSSAYVMGSVVTYTNACKERFARVKHETLQAYGAVSKETAMEMAEGIRQTIGTDIGLSVTGLAGPGGDGSGKPQGLVYVAVSGEKGTVVSENHFAGSRVEVKSQSAEKALQMLVEYLGGHF